MKTSLFNQSICFVGAGSMAEAIMKGLLNTKKVNSEQIYVINRQNQNRLAELRSLYGVQTAPSQEDKNRILKDADIIILAMKPKDTESALQEIAHLLNDKQLLISVIAGISISRLEQMAGPSIPIVRTMPNTSSTIGLGATGISYSSAVTAEQKKLTEDIFSSVGMICTVEEKQLDLVTGVSGSGPAYVYLMMETMIQAGIEGGLSEETAYNLAVQTVRGAAEMVKLTQESPAALRQKVTSPGGTTEAALDILRKDGFSEALMRAIHRAAERAAELGRSF